MKSLETILDSVTSPLPKQEIANNIVTILKQFSQEKIANDLLELLGFDILDNGVLDDIIGIRDELLVEEVAHGTEVQASAKPKYAAHESVDGQPIQTKRNPRMLSVSTQLYDMQFIDSAVCQKLSTPLLPVSVLPEALRSVFDFSHFNALQSETFKASYESAGNLLVAAPTSSGKTNVALLCIMQMATQLLGQKQIDITKLSSAQLKKELQQVDDLCVYLTPLKALASEITQKFKLELNQLGFRVLECTGDENPPQELIDNANVLILTPEKFDVITRKQSNQGIFLRQKLLIIDEIHLIGTESRGFVLESIICRTKCEIEELETPVRFVGISATLPNYREIAGFLECGEESIFSFGEAYRPVPLTQCLVGVKQCDLCSLDGTSGGDAAIGDGGNEQLRDVFSDLESVKNEIYSENEQTIDNQKKKRQREEAQKSLKAKKAADAKKALPRYIDVEDVYDRICCQIAVHNNERLLSTMVFVHSRRKSVELAKLIANKMPRCDFSQAVVKSVQGCEHGDLAFCMSRGVAFHNAQIDKQYKKIVEDQFRKGEVTVCVCTATLAWGVNLPAQTVVIRGTDVFTEFGQQDLDILDVKQIFGRAGRPQYMAEEDIGRGVILTRAEKLPFYLQQLNNESKIESHVGRRLEDVLNAEIVLGNVSTVGEAITYISKSFYATQTPNYKDMTVHALSELENNKLIYCDQKIVNDDGILIVATELGRICSHYYIPYNTLTDFISSVRECASLKTEQLLDLLCKIPDFQSLRPRKDEEELSQISGTFLEEADDIIEQQKYTNQQINQILKKGLKQTSYMQLSIDASPDEAMFKVNVLIQAFISEYELKTPSLVSDERLIIRSVPRIAQAFMEVLLAMKKGNEVLRINNLLNSILYQQWYQYASPFLPFAIQPVGTTQETKKSFSLSQEATPRRTANNYVNMQTIEQFHKHFPLSRFYSFSQLQELQFDDIKDVMGKAAASQIVSCIKMIPFLYIDAIAVPVSKKILRVSISCTPGFKFEKEIHGEGIDFLVLLTSQTNGQILKSEKISVTAQSLEKPTDIVALVKVEKWTNAQIDGKNYKNTQFIEELDDESGDNYPTLAVKCFPLNWCGGESIISELDIDTQKIAIEEGENISYPRINDEKLCFYPKKEEFTPLPKVMPLSIQALHWKEAQEMYKFNYFNPIQTVMFNTLYYNQENVFVGAPTSSGKTVAAELAALELLRDNPSLKILYIAPIKALVEERFIEWKEKFSHINAEVVQITGDVLPDMETLLKANIIIATPEKWDALSRSWQEKEFIELLGLMILDEVHLIGTSRGYVLESIVARYLMIQKMINFKIRMIALSTSTTNIRDVAEWLDVPYHNIFNFDSAARPVALQTHIESYIGDRYCARMDLMNRPVYQAIKKYAPNLPVLVFVESRKQTRKTAMALINLAIEDHSAPQCFLQFPNDDLAAGIEDLDAEQCIKFGVGIHNSGMSQSDRNIIEELYLQMKITILVCTATLAAGVNIPAYMTILKGCEYFDGNLCNYIDFDVVDVLEMCGRAGRPQYVQYRLKEQIKEYFGEEVLNYLNEKRALDKLYKFDKSYIWQEMPPNTPNAELILDNLEKLNEDMPESVSIIMCRESAKDFYKQFLDEPFPFESSLLNSSFGNPLAVALNKVSDEITSHFPDCVCSEITPQGTSYAQLRNWLQKTFFFIRARRNPELYGINMQDILEEIRSIDSLDEFENEFELYAPNDNIANHKRVELNDFFTCLAIYEILDKCLEELEQLEFVLIEGKGLSRILYQTEIGRCLSSYYLSYQTISKFLQGSPRDLQEVVQLVAEAEEFSKIPVRCPEPDEMKGIEAANNIPSIGEELFGSGHHKAYFSFYCHIKNISVFPTPEYKLDASTCLASEPRLAAALINLKAIQKQYSDALEVAKFSELMNSAGESKNGQLGCKIRLLEEKAFVLAEIVVQTKGFPNRVTIRGKVVPFNISCFVDGQFERKNGDSSEFSFKVSVRGSREGKVYCCSEQLRVLVEFTYEEAELSRDWKTLQKKNV